MSQMVGGAWMKGPNRINAKQLIFMGACQRAVKEFRALFGDGDVLLNRENVEKLHDFSMSANLYCAWLGEKIVGRIEKNFWGEINAIHANKSIDVSNHRAMMVEICMKYLGARHADFSTDSSKPQEPKSDPVCPAPSPPVQAEVQRGPDSPDGEAPRVLNIVI